MTIPTFPVSPPEAPPSGFGVTSALLSGRNPWAPRDQQPCLVGSAEYERRYPGAGGQAAIARETADAAAEEEALADARFAAWKNRAG